MLRFSYVKAAFITPYHGTPELPVPPTVEYLTQHCRYDFVLKFTQSQTSRSQQDCQPLHQSRHPVTNHVRTVLGLRQALSGCITARRLSDSSTARLIINNLGASSFKLHFQARPQICEKRLLVSSCLSVRMEQLGYRWTDFHEI